MNVTLDDIAISGEMGNCLPLLFKQSEIW